eukprot:CAMPEP_0114168438 /NCGR_PEP_ID=MMETSP0043_2-20121206/32991_1 /TAXON_ID=464988 /ORGANISM="Hemiselmis andersenii, Strain CCMP644" /LENGTH=38 /DNA_ID= /DNA_START= /DNA_END= /DNA_ORIENTATION=
MSAVRQMQVDLLAAASAAMGANVFPTPDSCARLSLLPL